MHFVYLPPTPVPPLPPPSTKKKTTNPDYCFQFLLGITVIPKEIEDNAYAKVWGINKVHIDFVKKMNGK